MKTMLNLVPPLPISSNPLSSAEASLCFFFFFWGGGGGGRGAVGWGFWREGENERAVFRLLLFLLGNPAGAPAEERDLILRS